MKKFYSKKTFLNDQQFHDDKVIITDDNGLILAIENLELHDAASLKIVDGILIPGFINVHCHLELSHMKGMAPTGTGLLPFLKTVVGYRDIAQEAIDAAIVDGDAEMHRNGIVAVGDISNKTDTAVVKSLSKIDYHTFVEMFDFLQPSNTVTTIAQYEAVFDAQSDHGHNKKTFVPHAPYTVTPGLFAYIKNANPSGSTISIHNQETPHENQLFMDGTGTFRDFFTGFGASLDHFEPTGQTSIYYAMTHMNPASRTLFVHNTMTTRGDIISAQHWSENTYWATCPNANLYIENRLPDYQAFLDTGATVTIGTDSLTSNWQLSIWDEIKTILRYQSYLPLETVLTWATLNGAKSLGYDDRLGSIEVGKQPGLIQVVDDLITRMV